MIEQMRAARITISNSKQRISANCTKLLGTPIGTAKHDELVEELLQELVFLTAYCRGYQGMTGNTNNREFIKSGEMIL